MTIKEYYRYYLQKLQTIYALDEASVIAGWVFENKVSLKRSDILRHPELLLTPSQLECLNKALHRLLQHEPVQYVLGEAWFYGMRLKVNSHVLIPRPETEELVEWIIADCNKQPALSILDIGTGSGCIAITLQKKIPHATVTAIDISTEALATAKDNAIDQDSRVNWIQLDFLNEAAWANLGSYDVIVSNPPYIPLEEKSRLDKNVTLFEPGTALFVPDHSPLLFYEKIARFAANHLNPDGKVFAETHEEFANATQHALAKFFKAAALKQDMFGKNRMIKATQYR
jgi:release factor glutamine methyltransferase